MQYNSVINLLVALELDEIIEITRKKRDSILELSYKVRTSIFSNEYQELQNEFQICKQKQEGKYSEIGKILKGMRSNLENRLIMADKFSRPNDYKKINAVLDDLIFQQKYNDSFSKFKSFESQINQILTTVNNGQLQKALLDLRNILPLYEKYLTNLESQAREQEAYAQFLQEAKNLKSKIQVFETKIKNQYKLLATGQKQKPITFKEIETSIKAPQLVTMGMEKVNDLNAFISDLDQQFAMWEGKEQSKSGKI